MSGVPRSTPSRPRSASTAWSSVPSWPRPPPLGPQEAHPMEMAELLRADHAGPLQPRHAAADGGSGRPDGPCVTGRSAGRQARRRWRLGRGLLSIDRPAPAQASLAVVARQGRTSKRLARPPSRSAGPARPTQISCALGRPAGSDPHPFRTPLARSHPIRTPECRSFAATAGSFRSGQPRDPAPTLTRAFAGESPVRAGGGGGI